MNETDSVSVPERRERGKYSWWVRLLAAVLVAAMLLGLVVTSAGRVTLEETGEGDVSDAAAAYLLDSTAYTSQSAWTRAKWALRSGLRKPQTYGDYEILASVALSREEYDKALPYFDKCIELYDGGEAGLASLWMKRASVQALLGDYKGSLESLNKQFKMGYTSASAYLLRAQLYIAQENYISAESDLLTYIQFAPGDLQTLSALAEVAYANFHMQLASECFTELLAHPESVYGAPEALLRRASCYMQMGRIEAGIADCGSYIELAGEGDGSAHFLRAIMESSKNDIKAAGADYLRAAELGYEQRAMAYEQAAQCAYELGDNEGCVKYGESALADGGELNAVAALYANMGLAYIALGGFASAQTRLSDAIKADPELRELYYYRGVSRLSTEDYEGAVEDFTLSIEYDPQSATSYYNRALAYLSLGDMEAAQEDLQTAVSFGDEEVTALVQDLVTALNG